MQNPAFEIDGEKAEERWQKMGWRGVWLRIKAVLQFIGTLKGLWH